MGVFKRYKDAQAAQKDAENAMPGAYQSNYTDRIDEAKKLEEYTSSLAERIFSF